MIKDKILSCGMLQIMLHHTVVRKKNCSLYHGVFRISIVMFNQKFQGCAEQIYFPINQHSLLARVWNIGYELMIIMNDVSIIRTFRVQQGKQHCISKFKKEMTASTCEVSFRKEGPKIIGDIILYEGTLQLQSISEQLEICKLPQVLHSTIPNNCSDMAVHCV